MNKAADRWRGVKIDPLRLAFASVLLTNKNLHGLSTITAILEKED
jgi:hypothetical protein